eukprot:CAMPEP_0185364894 /NCGR_PEP_ID=MMETSP1364-20130426/12699_1 /TAXON_ID=38817 /ORGANISM="Gephyrocapsa oceanica, Strain RCC1303" /LENGTH=71 /DNA_ID=CAMNT_0027965409 /DNA_START=21 /DNA_END=233 /DNA_ORIENTATION=-
MTAPACVAGESGKRLASTSLPRQERGGRAAADGQRPKRQRYRPSFARRGVGALASGERGAAAPPQAPPPPS